MNRCSHLLTPPQPSPKEEGAYRWMATKHAHKETRHQAGFFRMNRELLEHSLRGEAGDGLLPVLFKAGVVFGFKAGFQRFQVQRQGGDAFGQCFRQAEVLPGRLVTRAALPVLVVRGR